MLIVTDIYGNTEGVSGYKALKRYRNTSGERTLSFLLFPTEQNAHSFDLVSEESLIEFKGELFRVKQLREKPRGKMKVKEVVAIRKMFDLINSHQYDIHNGSLTFQAALQFVLGGTGYTWSIVDSFLAEDWENFGDDNRIALFQIILNRYRSEFTLDDRHFTFKRKIGNDSDYQFRYNYNIKTIDRSVNTNNLSTYIKGYGKDGLEVEYISPNADKFINPDSPDGYYHAKPVRDERYTSESALLERLKTEIQDEPELSITIDFVDMRRQGFPYDVPNEGDDVFLIYEPLDLDVEARIIEIEEEFIEDQEYPIRTNVTLANFRNSFMREMVNFKKTQKQVDGIFDGSAKLPYNVLDEAVRRATEALQSAQTELEFQNGIIARDPGNPNNLVLFTSAGIGVSRDGGATFNEALTYEGLVASVGVVGQFAANNIQIGAATTYESGYDPSKKETPTGAQDKANAVGTSLRNDLRLTAALPTSLTMNQSGITASTSDPSKYARFDYRGLYVNNGAIQVKRPDGFNTIIDGMVNQDFNVQGATPPFLVNAEILGRHFKTNAPSTGPGICQVFTFKKTARYLKFHIAIGVDVAGNQARAFVEQTGVPDVWLGSATGTTLITDGGDEKWITVDLGVPFWTPIKSFLKLAISC